MIEALDVYGWQDWEGTRCPVPPTARVEVIQAARHARGLALAFNWTGRGFDAVQLWRIERTNPFANHLGRPTA